EQEAQLADKEQMISKLQTGIAERDATLQRLRTDLQVAQVQLHAEREREAANLRREAQQLEQLRIELAERDARILAALEESRRADANGQSRTPVSVTAWPTAKKKIDRQQYREMIERVRRAVASAVPANATVAVVSKGDPELLQLQGRKGSHF